jgi:hypothetical protein
MRRSLLPALAACLLWVPTVWAQQGATFGGGNMQATAGTAGQLNRDAGLNQTGQVQSAGAISRQQEVFVGSSTSHILSVSGNATATVGGVGSLGGGLGGFGGGVPGFVGSTGGLRGGGIGGLGGGLGGLGGFGGGLGGFGGGLGGFGGGFGGIGFNSVNQATRQQGNQFQTPFRSKLRVDVQYTAPTATQVSRRFSGRLTRIPQLSETLRGVEARLTPEGVLVLTGEVATARDRDLAERMATLEPGVDQIQNELTVAADRASDEPLPPPAAGAGT